MSDAEHYIEYDKFQTVVLRAHVELLQKVDKLMNKLDNDVPSFDALIEEIRNRVLFETIDMDSDSKYLVRGVIESVLYDMKLTYRADESTQL